MGAHVKQRRTGLAAVGAARVTGVVGDASGVRLTIKAGEDVVLQGASAGNGSAAGATTIRAGCNVQLQTMTVGSASSVVADARNWCRSRNQQEIGSDISAQGEIGIQAGAAITACAARTNCAGRPPRRRRSQRP